MRDNLRSPAAWTRFLLTCALGLGLDLATKVWAFKTLVSAVIVDESGQPRVVAQPPYHFLPGWLIFEGVANPGAVFGIGMGLRWLFILVSIGAIALLTYLFLNSGKAKFYQVTLGLLLAGVLGNLYDRAMFGYVRDMVHIFPGRHWPDWMQQHLSFIPYFQGPLFPWIFNIADSMLCVGVAISIVYSFRRPASEARLQPAAEAR